MGLCAGDKIGPYEILAPIGAGGMGEVYRARDTRLDRDVAIKILPEHLAESPEGLARFQREGKAVAALSHPNILVLFDVGVYGRTHYAVTELLEGETLRERLSRSPLPWRKAIEIGVAIAEGLSAAHSKDIIHRDIKPGNIFITADGRVKILDFGLAGWQQTSSSDDETQTFAETTHAGAVMGTLGYMSPEQVRGEKTGPASDIFSLGCVLYECVTGKRAFSGRSPGDTMAAILKEEPPAVRDTGKQVPQEFERIIDRCLAKNSTQRFHSAHDLVFALKGMLSTAGETPAAAPVPTRRLPTSVAIAIALAILILPALFYWRGHKEGSIDSLAVLPFANAGGNPNAEYLSDGITDSLTDSLAEIPNLKVMSHSAVARYKGKDADVAAAGREMGVRAVLTGRITQRGDDLIVAVELVNAADNSHLWGEHYDRKVTDALAVQNEIAHQIADKLRLRLSSEQKARMSKRQTANPEAYQLYLKGRFFAGQVTPDGLEKGMNYFRQAIALDPTYALAYDGMSYYYAITDDLLAEPADVVPRSKEAALKALELDDSLVEAHVDLGAIYTLDFDWSGAEREFQRAISLNPNYAAAHEYYAWLLMSLGRTEQALREGQRSVELDPLSPEVHSILGWDFYFAHRYDEAAQELNKSLELDPNYFFSCFMLGQVYAQQGKINDAIAIERKAAGILPDSSWGLAEIARDYALSGKPKEARQTLDDLLSRPKPFHLSPYGVATTYAALGDRDKAFAELEACYKRRSFFLDFLKVDPELDTLRSDHRYQELVQRLKLR